MRLKTLPPPLPKSKWRRRSFRRYSITPPSLLLHAIYRVATYLKSASFSRPYTPRTHNNRLVVNQRRLPGQVTPDVEACRVWRETYALFAKVAPFYPAARLSRWTLDNGRITSGPACTSSVSSSTHSPALSDQRTLVALFTKTRHRRRHP